MQCANRVVWVAGPQIAESASGWRVPAKRGRKGRILEGRAARRSLTRRRHLVDAGRVIHASGGPRG